jgi:hypothetical protein
VLALANSIVDPTRLACTDIPKTLVHVIECLFVEYNIVKILYC